MQDRSPDMPARRRFRLSGSRWPHVILAGLVAAYSVFSYFRSFQRNPVTGETQRIRMTLEQEIALGRQAVPRITARYGGLHPDPQFQQRVARIGAKIVTEAIGDKNPYPFEFHVLKSERAINAFALPGGQVFVTAGLLKRLKTDGQVAGVLAHEIGHVIERHAAERLANAMLSPGLTGAIVIASYDPNDPESRKAAQVALAIAHLANIQYSREDELESDRDGVRLMAKAGYDPRAMIRVIEILRDARMGGVPDFFATHPEPERRIALIEEAITELFPEEVPAWMTP